MGADLGGQDLGVRAGLESRGGGRGSYEFAVLGKDEQLAVRQGEGGRTEGCLLPTDFARPQLDAA